MSHSTRQFWVEIWREGGERKLSPFPAGGGGALVFALAADSANCSDDDGRRDACPVPAALAGGGRRVWLSSSNGETVSTVQLLKLPGFCPVLSMVED